MKINPKQQKLQIILIKNYTHSIIFFRISVMTFTVYAFFTYATTSNTVIDDAAKLVI